MDNGKIAYVYSDKLLTQCDRLPTMLKRASMVQELINSYKLLDSDNIITVLSADATEDELKTFHSTSYIDFLKDMKDRNQKGVDSQDCSEEQLEHGLSYDCPLLDNCYDFISTIAGGSLTGAKLLVMGKCRIAINWFGGWHHAQRDSAEGFCYVNDIVVAMHKLTERFVKVLYVDLDTHHGNGVQNAFEFSNKILTLSFHIYSPGFYPGTGDLEDVGKCKGKYYSINVPLLPDVGHKTFLELFDNIFPRVYEAFQPEALVVQCGADSLNGDPIGESNLTIKTYQHCLKRILECNLPTLFLGGGGYNFPNTARLWASLTSLICDYPIEEDIPDTCDFFLLYGPTYELHIDEGRKKDNNTKEWIEKIIATIDNYCNNIE